MIQKIKTCDVRKGWVESLERAKMRASLRKLTLIFVPGVEGNERADQLASLATTTDGQPMDRADILIALRESSQSEDFEMNEHESISRMRELGVRMGIVRREHLTKISKRAVNQHRTGTISRYTLRDLLKRRSEHLWTCPVCEEDNQHT